MNCVVVDIGNTSTAVGLARDGVIGSVCHLHGGLKDKLAIAHVVRGLCGQAEVAGAALCSVVPAANGVWLTQMRRLLGCRPLVVTHKVELGVRVSYPRPATIGADRLANASGAIARYGAPTIVADFGTAVTFDVIVPRKGYVGGVIAPGLPLMTDYLYEKTALLPRIRLRGRFGAVGRSTAEAMRIGAKVGYRGMVREIVTHLTRGLKLKKVALCGTGGYAKWALEGLDMPFTIDADLTLFGISRIWELNAGRRDD